MDQIFFSHSSNDRLLKRRIRTEFELLKIDKGLNIRPYFAGDDQDFPDKERVRYLYKKIKKSKAVFAIITTNVLYQEHTRDWVCLEFGLARGLGIPIEVWRQIPTPSLRTHNYPKGTPPSMNHNEPENIRSYKGISFLENEDFGPYSDFKINWVHDKLVSEEDVEKLITKIVEKAEKI